MGTVLLVIICLTLMVIGLVGVIVPFLPGVPLAWLGLFIYALATGFDKISILATVIFFVVMLVTLALDLIAPMLGVKNTRQVNGVLSVFFSALRQGFSF